MTRRGGLALGLLFVLPAAAHAPAWLNDRLLGPGDGTYLHYPLRAEVWRALSRGELPAWSPALFGGTPLLASYRPGALYPPMAALSPLPPFVAFQLLVLGSLGAAGVLTFLYLRHLGAHPVGAFFGGLAFGSRPLPREPPGRHGHGGGGAPPASFCCSPRKSHARRAGAARAAGLAGALALLLLAGSPEPPPWRALTLLLGRLVLLHARPRAGGPPPAHQRPRRRSRA